MKTRRPLVGSGARRVSFAGFPSFERARAIGFHRHHAECEPVRQGDRRLKDCATVDVGKLPADLRTRPSTSLAFEFLDQPFLLDLGIESSPPLVRADLKTIFRIDADRARSETTIELDWVRGRLTEVELGVAAGLQLTSVGPPEVVESSHLSDVIAARGPGAAIGPARRLRIRLTSSGRDANKVTLKLTGLQQIAAKGKSYAGTVHSHPGSLRTCSLCAGCRPWPRAGARRTIRGGFEFPANLPRRPTSLCRPARLGTLRDELGPEPLCAGRTTTIHGCSKSKSRAMRERLPRRPRSRPRFRRRWVDVLERSTFGVHHGVLALTGDSGAGRDRRIAGSCSTRSFPTAKTWVASRMAHGGSG